VINLSGESVIADSFWDSIIVGSALFSECGILVSEDMQNGLSIAETLAIKNIFLP
jgi:predicted nucleic acid-binding protein